MNQQMLEVWSLPFIIQLVHLEVIGSCTIILEREKKGGGMGKGRNLLVQMFPVAHYVSLK